jgi:hypothetical protein
MGEKFGELTIRALNAGKKITAGLKTLALGAILFLPNG